MSHRTKSLPQVRGVRGFIRDLRYHEASRQLLALVFVALVAWLGEPVRPLLLAGVPFVAAGVLVRLWASGHVMKNEVLATNGPYGYVRHPLYVGNILILAGFSLASGLWWAGPLALALLYFYYPPAIEYEDRKLSSLFGEQWESWRAYTRALLPRLRPFTSGQSSEWSFLISLKRNGEPFIIVYLAACLYVLYARSF